MGKSHPPLPLQSRLNKGSTIHATLAVREQKVIDSLHSRALPRASGAAGNRRPEGLLLYFVRNAALNASTAEGTGAGLLHPPSGAAAICLREFPCLSP